MASTHSRGIDPYYCAHHGKRLSEHEGGRCLYCCICFKTLAPDECAVDSDGQKWDTCEGQCAKEAGIRLRVRRQPSEPEPELGADYDPHHLR